MMNLEEQYGGKSSFYFLALPEESENSTYDIEEISNEMKEITERGWEVGLHGSLEAYNDLSLMTREKEKIERALGKKVIGYRNHFLRFKIPTTWELIRLAGFKYDTTFGYNCKVGFRNGMCHPFFPFNLETNRPIDILEIPMAAQDAFYGSIIGFDLNGAWETMKALIDETERYNGVITVLWHNTRMTGDSLRLYKKVLSYSLSKNAWIASAEEIYRWWVDSGFKTKYSEH
jgi:peptidoglycan/xylan/chitin deacetylase (PgdA/CDA1 family)